MHTLRRHQGFSLIELLIVLAIIGIIAGIAYPSYMNSVRKANRDDAKAGLVQLAAALERRYSTQVPRTYDGAAQGALPSAPLAAVFPSSTPLDSNRPVYNLFIDVATANSFSVRAQAVAGANVFPECTAMTYTNTGQKAPADCWN